MPCRIHFAEEWNEVQHLKIMEALGGDRLWIDRFLARHAAVFYFVILNHLWLFSPSLAYNFSELIEFHAVDTYGEFVDANEELLKKMPAPKVPVCLVVCVCVCLCVLYVFMCSVYICWAWYVMALCYTCAHAYGHMCETSAQREYAVYARDRMYM
jgi:hypothetical protein